MSQLFKNKNNKKNNKKQNQHSEKRVKKTYKEYRKRKRVRDTKNREYKEKTGGKQERVNIEKRKVGDHVEKKRSVREIK